MRSKKGLHCTSNAMRRPLSVKRLHRRRAFVARRGARRPSHGLMAISHAVRWRTEVAQAAVTRRAGEQARADDHSARELRRTRPVLPPLVHTSLATRHGDAADAERDGVALPDLDRCIADTVGYAPVKERSSERNALELSACTQSTIQSTEHRR